MNFPPRRPRSWGLALGLGRRLAMRCCAHIIRCTDGRAYSITSLMSLISSAFAWTSVATIKFILFWRSQSARYCCCCCTFCRLIFETATSRSLFWNSRVLSRFSTFSALLSTSCCRFLSPLACDGGSTRRDDEEAVEEEEGAEDEEEGFVDGVAGSGARTGTLLSGFLFWAVL